MVKFIFTQTQSQALRYHISSHTYTCAYCVVASLITWIAADFSYHTVVINYLGKILTSEIPGTECTVHEMLHMCLVNQPLQ